MILAIPALILFLLIGAVLIFNKLVSLRQMTENGWSDIEVQLKRRADLIPRLVSTVKGYASHERKLFEDVTTKRMQALAAGNNPRERGVAESRLKAPMGRIIALAEDYPDLKASDNFLELQKELSDTENKIEMARRFYNGAVRELNIKINTIPSNLVAGPMGFKTRDYFEIDISDASAPDVEFSA
jgi:LemA protein